MTLVSILSAAALGAFTGRFIFKKFQPAPVKAK